MGLWNAEPPQGHTSEQGLLIIGRSPVPRFGAPQGIKTRDKNFLLDLFPGAAASYSLRQLSSTYFGPCIRVERTSDNTFQDFGFLPDGSLDTAAIVAFVGTGPTDNGHAIIIYDQSGNNRNLDLSVSLVRSPKIIVDGVLQTTNGLPSVFFDGSSDALEHTVNAFTSPASHLFVFGVWRKLSLGDSPLNFNLNTPKEGSGIGERVSVHAPFSSGAIFWDPGSAATDRLTTTADFNDLLQHIYTFTKTAGTDKQIIKRDGIQLAQKTQSTTSTEIGFATLGAFSSTSLTFSSHMQWQELVFYDTDKFNDISNIENNIISSWISLINGWIDDLGNQFVDDLGNNLVFEI